MGLLVIHNVGIVLGEWYHFLHAWGGLVFDNPLNNLWSRSGQRERPRQLNSRGQCTQPGAIGLRENTGACVRFHVRYWHCFVSPKALTLVVIFKIIIIKGHGPSHYCGPANDVKALEIRK